MRLFGKIFEIFFRFIFWILIKVRRFRGNKQGFYVIHSCFGGENDELIASGSEDATIFIFHRDRETPLIELQGHGKILKYKFLSILKNTWRKNCQLCSFSPHNFRSFGVSFRRLSRENLAPYRGRSGWKFWRRIWIRFPSRKCR